MDREKGYRMNRSSCRDIFDSKLSIVISCRSSWPQFASYVEDSFLRKSKWNDKYEGKRVVMWDDTNIDFQFKPGGADEQRMTYSSYYGGNVGKGGIFLHLCGWLGVEHLWVGATSDKHYQENSGIFQKQEKYAKHDLVDEHIISFQNMSSNFCLNNGVNFARLEI